MIIPLYIDILFFVILMIVMAILGYGFYLFIYIPSYKIYMDLQSPPPQEGTQLEIVLEPNLKRKIITIGSITATIPLRLKGIEDLHAELIFEKEKGLEEYEITLKPIAKNKVLWKAPHVKNMIVLNEADTIQSSELIGHPAYFRIVALMQNNRPIHYVEFELSMKYFIDNLGEERIKFFLKINKIYPGIDLKSRDKKGIYSFGRLKTEDKEEVYS